MVLSIVSRETASARSPLSPSEVGKALWRLRALHLPYLPNRQRIRMIMDGGDEGIRAILGPRASKNRELIPAANMILSAGTKLAAKIGRFPMLKVPPPEDADSQRQHDKAELIESIVGTFDQWSRVRMQMPQIGRWLPGYGFYVWVIRERTDRDGNPYPSLNLRDPFDCFPGTWTTDQMPRELGVLRRVDANHLAEKYPAIKNAQTKPSIRVNSAGGGAGGWAGGTAAPQEARWDNISGEGIIVGEYYNDDGWWFVAPEYDLILDYVPNVSPWCPQFVVGKRYTFSALTGHYDHAIGLQAAQARLTMWGIIAMGDAVFAETNIFGDSPRGGKYKKGRDAINVFAQGASVSKPNQNLPYQMFQQIDRVERMLRNQVTYPVTDDAESPVGYATGPAVEGLQDAVSGEVHEYQLAAADALMRADYIRLAWDEERFGGRYRKRLHNRMRTYDPSSIGGRYDTERIYGVMSGWDEPRKIVNALQLIGAEVLDPQTAAENIDGIDDFAKIDARNKARRVERGLMSVMEQQGVAGDARAILSLIELLPEGDTKAMFQRYFSPDPDQSGEPSPEEQALIAQQEAAGAALPEQQPDVQTILTQLGIDGGMRGGAQVVARTSPG